MKQIPAITGLMMMVCVAGFAQEVNGDRIVVPARNSTRPRLLDASVLNGSLVVKTHSGKDVIVETKSSEGKAQPTRGTMKRVMLPPAGLEVEEQDNNIKVRMHSRGDGVVTVLVPADTSVRLRAQNGSIEVDGLRGELDVQSQNGPITMRAVSGTVMAYSHNGEVKVSIDRLDAAKPISFSSWNGNIDVTLPADFKANVKLKTNRGEIWSDFDVKLMPGQTVVEKSESSKDGKFRVRNDRTFAGTINGGGQEATFTTYNGSIQLHRK